MIAAASLIWAALVFVLWRDVLPLLHRMVTLAERRHAPAVEAGSTETPNQLPPDIEQLAQGESEEWARDAVRERAWELFRFTKNWDEAGRILHAERMVTLLGGEPGRGVN
jgi:hypothetical protein